MNARRKLFAVIELTLRAVVKIEQESYICLVIRKSAWTIRVGSDRLDNRSIDNRAN
jgi:hypothetical protein